MRHTFPLRAVVIFLMMFLIAAGATVAALLSTGVDLGSTTTAGGTQANGRFSSSSEGVADILTTVTNGQDSGERAPCVTVGYGAPSNWSRLSNEDLERTMAEASLTGATMVRVSIEWDLIEIEPGKRDWAVSDRLIDSAQRHDLAVLALLIGTPEWARDPKGNVTSSMTPPIDESLFGQFAGAAAHRYGHAVYAWEVWNEPNIADFWTTGADPAAYAKMLRSAHSAIKTVLPHAPVLTGGLAPSETSDGYYAPNDFLQALYTNGAQDSFDGYAIHPYSYPDSPADPAKPWSPWKQMFDARRILTAHGDGAKDVWITEFGAPTGTDEKSVSAMNQARIIEDGISEAARIPWIHVFVIYTLRDVGENEADKEHNFGVFDFQWEQKPAAAAVRTMATRHGCR